MPAVATGWCGQSVERAERAALPSGSGCFIDDLGVKPRTLHAASLRSPHPHDRIVAIGMQAVRVPRLPSLPLRRLRTYPGRGA